MRKIQKFIYLFIISFLFSCTEKFKENQNTLSAFTNEQTDSIGNSSDKIWEKRSRERKLKGDTLPMSFKDLQKYLPMEISGYKAAGVPKGESVDIPGMSFSLAEQIYKKGENQLTIFLYDYNGAHDMYIGATALFSSGMPVKNQEEIANVVLIKENIKGWMSFKRKDKKSELMIGVAERFYLHLKMDKQEGIDFVGHLAKGLDLDSLNNL